MHEFNAARSFKHGVLFFYGFAKSYGDSGRRWVQLDFSDTWLRPYGNSALSGHLDVLISDLYGQDSTSNLYFTGTQTETGY